MKFFLLLPTPSCLLCWVDGLTFEEEDGKKEVKGMRKYIYKISAVQQSRGDRVALM
jgi:hypothetical protein